MLMLDFATSVKCFKEHVCISKSLPGSDSIYKSSIYSWKKVSCEFSGVFARPFSVTAISGLQSISANKIVIAKASHN